MTFEKLSLKITEGFN